MAYRIKNWQEHQHFKDRRPPWVKLYRHLLDDPDWHDLSGDNAKALVMLWLVASEDNTMQGILPNERNLAFRLRVSEKQLKQILNSLNKWLIHDDISLISDQYQLDAPETETETETENRDRSAPATLLPDWLQVETWNDYLETRKVMKSPMTDRAKQLAITKLDELRKSGHDPTQVLNQSIYNGWKGLFPVKPDSKQSEKGQTRHERLAEHTAILTGQHRRQQLNDPGAINGTAERLD